MEREWGRDTLERGAASSADVDGVVGELRQELLALGAPHHPHLLLLRRRRTGSALPLHRRRNAGTPGVQWVRVAQERDEQKRGAPRAEQRTDRGGIKSRRKNGGRESWRQRSKWKRRGVVWSEAGAGNNKRKRPPRSGQSCHRNRRRHPLSLPDVAELS